jgi:hypothetical protein
LKGAVKIFDMIDLDRSDCRVLSNQLQRKLINSGSWTPALKIEVEVIDRSLRIDHFARRRRSGRNNTP